MRFLETRASMDRDFTSDKIAVLIDADNAQLKALKAILDEISKYGRIIVKKAYGDWKNPSLKNWEDELKQLAIKPEQQFAYTKGKNATDFALVIDAMDLLYTNNYNAFVIVCSDADYTPLAIRLRETGAYIFGVGEDKTPTAFRNSCDSFLLTKHLLDKPEEPAEEVVAASSAAEEPVSEEAAAAGADSVSYDLSEIHKLLKAASETYQDDDGWVNAATAGNYIRRARPDFELKAYGFSKLSDLLNKHKNMYEVKKQSNGKLKICSYKMKS
ncbi:MAG: NYN domain-containing protein [Clostridiales bacterium]|nr:NYN domain-containing protein [Clostridiales bacterium]